MTLDPNTPPDYLVGHLEDALARDERVCEQGGFGVQAAAPVACQILTAYYESHKGAEKAAGHKVGPGSCAGPSSAPTSAAGNPY